jgi:hypothetical protein
MDPGHRPRPPRRAPVRRKHPDGQVAGGRHFARTPRRAALRGVWPGAGIVVADPSAAATRTGCGSVAAAARHSVAGGRGVVQRRAGAVLLMLGLTSAQDG